MVKNLIYFLVECDEDYDHFLTTRGQSIKLDNIKLIHTSSNFFTLVVEKGQTLLRNCEFRCDTDGIIVRQGAELKMENCKVYGSMVCQKSNLKSTYGQ
jgi:flagellar basal body rod protein FlgG